MTKPLFLLQGYTEKRYLGVICCFLSDNKLHTVHLNVIIIASLKVTYAVLKSFLN